VDLHDADPPVGIAEIQGQAPNRLTGPLDDEIQVLGVDLSHPMAGDAILVLEQKADEFRVVGRFGQPRPGRHEHGEQELAVLRPGLPQ